MRPDTLELPPARERHASVPLPAGPPRGEPQMNQPQANQTRSTEAPTGSIWPWLVILVLVIAAGVGIWWLLKYRAAHNATDATSAQSAANRAVPVVTATARKGDMNLYLTGLGSVTPLNTVTVRSRVDGQIDQIAFTEGQAVHEGDLLMQIDPRPYEVVLEQVQGQLARDQAQYQNAKSNVDRDKSAGNAISAQQLDTDAALMNQTMGVIQTDQGQIDAAKLNLTYCKITAPISGRIGLRLIDKGNIIHASDQTGLAVITQLQPISVLFTLPEQSVAGVIQKYNAGQPLAVDAYDRDLRNKIATGTLAAVDNQVDPNTGTVRLKATFGNEDNALFPNQFVNARLLIDTLKDAVLVPAAAVQRGAQSTFVYVVQPDQTVAMRTIEAGPTEGPDTAISSGVNAGDVVVTDGVDKLQQGTKVMAAKPEAGGGKGDGAGGGGEHAHRRHATTQSAQQ